MAASSAARLQAQHLVDRAGRDGVVARARPGVERLRVLEARGRLLELLVERLEVLAPADVHQELLEARVGRVVAALHGEAQPGVEDLAVPAAGEREARVERGHPRRVEAV